MIQAFLILFGFIAILSVVVMTTVSSFYSTQQLSSIQRDKDELSIITKQIINNIRYENGIKIVPYGVNNDFYHQLPDWLVANKNNPFGYAYMYCPYSANNTIAQPSTVKLNNDYSYQVSLISNSGTGNKNYVIGSEPAPFNGVLAFIISFKEPSSYTCNDIDIVDGTFSLPDPKVARVSAISADSVLTSDLTKTETFNVADNPSNPLMMEDTLEKWSETSPDKFYINTTSDTLFIDNGLGFENQDYTNEKMIYLVGVDPNNPTIIENTNGVSDTQTQPIKLSFKNVTLVVKNMNFNGKFLFELDNVNLFLENAVINHVKASNSKLVINKSSFKGGKYISLPILNAYNSEIRFIKDNTYTFDYNLNNTNSIVLNHSKVFAEGINLVSSQRSNTDTIQLFSSQFDLSDSTFNLTTSSGIPLSSFMVDSASSLSIYNSNLKSEQASTLINSYGNVLLSSVGISMDNLSENAIVLNRGSKLEMNNSNILDSVNGQKPNYGILDIGGMFISGDNNNIAALNCVSGDLFDKKESITFNDDTIMSVNNDFSVVRTTENETKELDMTGYVNKFNFNCI